MAPPCCRCSQTPRARRASGPAATAAAATAASTTAPTTNGCPQRQPGDGIRGDGTAGRIPRPHAPAISDDPINASSAVSRTPAETIVGTDEPGMRNRRSAIFSASPPRAGAKALSATPPAYAHPTVQAEMRFPGYAAASTLRSANERSARLRAGTRARRRRTGGRARRSDPLRSRGTRRRRRRKAVHAGSSAAGAASTSSSSRSSRSVIRPSTPIATSSRTRPAAFAGQVMTNRRRREGRRRWPDQEPLVDRDPLQAMPVPEP